MLLSLLFRQLSRLIPVDDYAVLARGRDSTHTCGFVTSSAAAVMYSSGASGGTGGFNFNPYALQSLYGTPVFSAAATGQLVSVCDTPTGPLLH